MFLGILNYTNSTSDDLPSPQLEHFLTYILS